MMGRRWRGGRPCQQLECDVLIMLGWLGHAGRYMPSSWEQRYCITPDSLGAS